MRSAENEAVLNAMHERNRDRIMQEGASPGKRAEDGAIHLQPSPRRPEKHRERQKLDLDNNKSMRINQRKPSLSPRDPPN